MVIQCLHWMATNEGVGSATLILLGSSPTGVTVAPAFTAHGDPMPSLNGHQWEWWQCHSDPVRELPNWGQSDPCFHCSWWSSVFTTMVTNECYGSATLILIRELPNWGHSGTCIHCSWWSTAFTAWPQSGSSCHSDPEAFQLGPKRQTSPLK